MIWGDKSVSALRPPPPLLRTRSRVSEVSLRPWSKHKKNLCLGTMAISALQLHIAHRGSNWPNRDGKKIFLPTGQEGSTGDAVDPGPLVTEQILARSSLAGVAGGLRLGVDVPIATPMSSFSGSPCCIPMLSVVNISAVVSTVRLVAASPRLFFTSCAGSPFNMLILPGTSFSACKCSNLREFHCPRGSP